MRILKDSRTQLNILVRYQRKLNNHKIFIPIIALKNMVEEDYQLKIESIKEDTGVQHNIYRRGEDEPLVDPKSLTKDYQPILKLHEQVIKNTGLEKIITFV